MRCLTQGSVRTDVSEKEDRVAYTARGYGNTIFFPPSDYTMDGKGWGSYIEVYALTPSASLDEAKREAVEQLKAIIEAIESSK